MQYINILITFRIDVDGPQISVSSEGIYIPEKELIIPGESSRSIAQIVSSPGFAGYAFLKHKQPGPLA